MPEDEKSEEYVKFQAAMRKIVSVKRGHPFQERVADTRKKRAKKRTGRAKPYMDIDESKNEQFLAVTQAHAAYRTLQRQLDKALSISDTHAIPSGTKIEVSGATEGTAPQPTKIVLSPGEDHYELALRSAKAFEMYKRASGQ